MASFDTSGLRAFKRLAILVVIGIVMMIAGCSCTTRIDAGHVGVRVKLAGSDRGVQDSQVQTGWVAYNPAFEQIVQFPVSVQNVVWTASPHEGRAVDESITFSSNEGVNVNADVGLSFHIEPSLAPKLYARFRLNDMQQLADGYMRNVVRESFNEAASKIPVQDIYGAGKSKLIADVTGHVRDVLGKDGIVIDQLTINGAMRLPQNVADAINRAMEATQNAIQSENRVRQVRAEADQAVTQATGAAEATRQKAQGEADAILIRARAEAQANEIIRLSVSPAVLQYRALDHWDGKLPQYNAGGQVPLLTFDVTKLAGGMDEGAREKRLQELLKESAPNKGGGSGSQAPAQQQAPQQSQPQSTQPATQPQAPAKNQ
jgi:regulator of protease activity HflC (stomatin/prohibitin superfamily)